MGKMKAFSTGKHGKKKIVCMRFFANSTVGRITFGRK